MRKTKLYQSCHASRPRSCHRSHRRRGITSACAEQTNGSTTDAPRRRDHLRVCGADWVVRVEAHVDQGSPPRVRSRPNAYKGALAAVRITSACAEQTGGATELPICPRDHLRVCGADDGNRTDMTLDDGSPPRVRSRPAGGRCRTRVGRITSACAEQTATACSMRAPARDHLRVCGADISSSSSTGSVRGSPPRVRSRPEGSRHDDNQPGITSACAEQTRACPGWTPIRRGSPPRVRSRQHGRAAGLRA